MHTLDDAIYWHGYSDAAQVIGGFATAFSLCVALLAATLVIYQAKASRKISREAGALEVHREYLKLCIEYPELSSSEALLKHLSKTSCPGLESLDGISRRALDVEVERGLWFLSYVLHTSEQIVETTRQDPAWRAVAESQIGYHRETIIDVWPIWRKHYGPDMIRLVEHSVR